MDDEGKECAEKGCWAKFILGYMLRESDDQGVIASVIIDASNCGCPDVKLQKG